MADADLARKILFVIKSADRYPTQEGITDGLRRYFNITRAELAEVPGELREMERSLQVEQLRYKGKRVFKPLPKTMAHGG